MLDFQQSLVLSKLKTTKKSLERAFRSDIQMSIIHVLEMVVRLRLNYQLTRLIASLSPIKIATISDEILITWFNALVTALHESLWIAALEVKKAEEQ